MRALLLAALVAASACTGTPPVATVAPSPTPDAVGRGGSIRVAVASDLGSLDPWSATEGATLDVLGQVYEPLVALEPGGFRPLPRLATGWSSSPDARVWTFTLRTGVRFQDGTAFDASAVVFDFERARSSSRFGLATLIDSVTAPDPATVVFTLTAPFAPFPATLASAALGMVSPSCVRQGPAWTSPATRCAAGTGPFKVEPGAWRTGERVTLTRNAGYWGVDASGRRLPYLDGIVFVPVRDEAVRVGGLKAANVDLALGLGPASVRALRSDPNIAPARGPFFATVFVGFGALPKPFDRDVRRAIAMTLDRGAIVQAVYAGEERPAAQLLPPGLVGYDDTVTQFVGMDTAAAKKLLVDAGVATPLSTELWYSPESSPALPDPRRVAESVASDLAKIGVVAAVRSEDATQFAADARAGRLPLWIGVRAPERADPDDFLADATSDPVALELLRRARGELDASKRAELYKQVTKLVQQNVFRIPLVHAARLIGASRKLRGLVPAAIAPEPLEKVYIGN